MSLQQQDEVVLVSYGIKDIAPTSHLLLSVVCVHQALVRSSRIRLCCVHSYGAVRTFPNLVRICRADVTLESCVHGSYGKVVVRWAPNTGVINWLNGKWETALLLYLLSEHPACVMLPVSHE